MIKEKELKVKISSRNSYLRQKYNCKYGDEIMVKVEDISKDSHMRITVICDECGKETSITIHKYWINFFRHDYYGCRDCSRKKFVLTNLDSFGKENPMQNKDIKKIRKRFL